MSHTTTRECRTSDAIRERWALRGELTPEQTEHVVGCVQCADTVRWLHEFAQLAEQPVGRGPEAGELWARAEVARRLDAQAVLGDVGSQSPAAWRLLGPLLGASAALLLVAGTWLGTQAHWGAGGVGGMLALAAGCAGVLVMAACSSVALLWNEL